MESFELGTFVIVVSYRARGSEAGANTIVLYTTDADTAQEFVKGAFNDGLSMQDHADVIGDDPNDPGRVITFRTGNLLAVCVNVRVEEWPELDDNVDGAIDLDATVEQDGEEYPAMMRYLAW